MYQTLTFADSLNYAYQNIVVKFIQYLPFLISAIIILFLGWILASVIARSLNRIFRLLRVDKIFDQADINQFLKNAGSKRDGVALLVYIVKLILLLVVFAAALQSLRLSVIAEFFNQLIEYAPNLLATVTILLIGAILSNVVQRMIEGASKAGKVSYGLVLALISKYSILIFSVIAALSQLNIAKELLQILFAGLVFMTALAGGLAFGLGGQESARNFLAKIKKDS